MANNSYSDGMNREATHSQQGSLQDPKRIQCRKLQLQAVRIC